MTGKSSEVREVLERRRVDVCCVEETRGKGGSTKMVRGKSAGTSFCGKNVLKGFMVGGVSVRQVCR